MGKLSDILRLLKEVYYFTSGLHLIENNYLTAELFNKIIIPDNRWVTIIHNTAIVDKSVILEPSILVMYNAYVALRIHINVNTNIGHDEKCGSLCHLATGATNVSCSSVGYCADVIVSATVLKKY